MCITRCFEEICTLLWRETLDKSATQIPQRINGALWFLPPQGFEFGKGHLNGVHAGGVWRQIKTLRVQRWQSPDRSVSGVGSGAPRPGRSATMGAWRGWLTTRSDVNWRLMQEHYDSWNHKRQYLTAGLASEILKGTSNREGQYVIDLR